MPTFSVSITEIFNCPIESAFKTPMLCDVTLVHTGSGFMPKLSHVTDDETWGKIGGTKRVYAEKNMNFKGGYVSRDTVLDRKENALWKIQVDDFQSWMLGFNRFVGEWETLPISEQQTKINYTYTLYATLPILYPFQWLFVHLFWKSYMRHAMENVQKLAYAHTPYMYS